MNCPKTLPEALAKIYADVGLETLKNPEKLLAVFADIAPNLKAERFQVEILVKSGCAKKLSAAADAGSDETRKLIATAVDTLSNDYLMDAKKAEELCGIYVNALVGGKQEPEPVPVQAPAVQEVPCPEEKEEASFHFNIEDAFMVKDRGMVVTGWIRGAAVHVGDAVTILRANGTKRDAVIGGIEHYQKLYDSMEPGKAVGLLLNGLGYDAVSAGDKLVAAAAEKTETVKTQWASADSNTKFLMAVEMVFPIAGCGMAAAGCVKGATVRLGKGVAVVDANGTRRDAVVAGIELVQKQVDRADPGDAVGILLEGLKQEEIADGDRLLPADSQTGFQMDVAGTFCVEGRGMAATGWMQDGSVHLNDTVKIACADGTQRTANVMGIELYHALVDHADAEDLVVLLLTGIEADEIAPGDQVMAKDDAAC